MELRDDRYKLRTELDVKQFEISSGEIERFDRALRPLRVVVDDFPVAELFVTVVQHPRPRDYHVTTALRLPSRTLFTGDQHPQEPYTAFERCVRKLVAKVGGHKDALSAKAKQHRAAAGTLHQVLPEREPDVHELRRAFSEGDYRSFREQMDVYYTSLRLRVGRWIQRYPEAEARLNLDLTLDDFVEETFLNAFESFDRLENRPEIRLGEWLESWIDVSVRAMLHHSDAEKENVRFAKTLTDLPQG